ncbi:MAG: hypothetical protein IPK82_35930 [Polyangiaceae bacterium]|nr:hypothetical protein [Polyangiaceae bacterium]
MQRRAVGAWGVWAFALPFLFSACDGQLDSSTSTGTTDPDQTSSTGVGASSTGGVVSTVGVGGTGGNSSTASTGGMSTSSTGGMGGQAGSTSGSGGCTDACEVSTDCPDNKPFCALQGGCAACFGMCDSSQCTGSNTCVSDADCNSSPNAKCVCDANNCTMCVLSIPSGPPEFPAELGEGVWLIGWFGGLDHFSWFKFAFAGPDVGTFDLLDPLGVTLTPFYPCQGKGLFTTDAAQGILHLTLPATCNLPVQHLTFEAFFPPGDFPPHATLAAQIAANQGPLGGYQHAADFCNADFTACGDPFMP